AYSVYRVTDAPADNWAKAGDVLILADKLADGVFKQARVTAYEKVQSVPGSILAAFVCGHPLRGKGGYDFDVPLLAGDHVTDDAGTGFVHTAPGLTGKRVINDKGEKGDANEAVIKALIEAKMIIARGRLKHQYPHSWRSKKPVIFRNTPQWFIAMDKPVKGLRDTLRGIALRE